MNIFHCTKSRVRKDFDDHIFFRKQIRILGRVRPKEKHSCRIKAGTCTWTFVGRFTWRARRKGLTGPLAVWAPSHGVCLQTILPLQPARTLLPPTASSTYHMSGFICHRTNPPVSASLAPYRFFVTLVAVSNSEAIIFTFPIAYAFWMEFCNFCPPDAAVYCCNMYWADEVSCNNKEMEGWANNMYLTQLWVMQV